jgi:uncharacterized protein YggE
MVKFRYILLLLCLVLATMFTACERDTVVVGSVVEGVQVTGTGSASGDPDVVVLSMGVVAQEKNLEEAHAAAAFAMQQVLDSLKISGVAENDIQTTQFSIRPVYNYVNSQRILQGYEVSNIVSVKVRDMDKTSPVIDNAVTAGGKWIQVNSISFTIDDPEELQTQAREEAMKDARAKAQTLAALGGVTLGAPVSISETAGSGPIYRYGMDSVVSEDVATPIEPGEVEITVTVTVVYNIE